ncbi:hypothetical protein F7734_47170 [Scytonema sp. UIC 10036]|uniref:hypothetical protein n=1 Tax=Scytonema sp. UIC 10036 TaxID=2304196 RepID=UPI0012DA998F|nr:hypothetical protein [Scytonema sp. UIC 10036]MUG99471.1 hypothetical protein [Scytonema sp. UIC 10036]
MSYFANMRELTNINNLPSIVLWESGYSQFSQQKLTTMPSASSGRYQSRLFNFFHQQSQRWGEQFERTIRQIQVTASWSIEGLLHSVYMLIQTAIESSSRQLNAGEQKRSLQLQGDATDSQQPSPQSADNAVARVLEVVPTLKINDNKTQESKDRDKHFFQSRYIPIFHHPHPFVLHSPTPQSPSTSSQYPIANPQHIRGVASNLATRNLVLVTANNEIFDILTLQQQKKLQNRIHEELRTRELQQVQLIEPALDETQIVSEIERLLNKLVSGQKENEPALPQDAIAEDKNTLKNLPIPLPGLAMLDQTIAKLEANTLVSISRTSSELLQAAQSQFNIFFYGKKQQITSQEKVLATEVDKNQTSDVLSLIWEAIHYFFGEDTTKQLEQNPSSKSGDRKALPVNHKIHRQLKFSGQSIASKALPETSQFQDDETVDPWLTMDDLFNNSSKVSEVNGDPNLRESFSNTNFTLPETLFYPGNILHYFQSKTSKLKEILGSVNRQKSTSDLPQTAKKRRHQKSSRKLRIGTNSSSSSQKSSMANSQSQITEFDSQKMKGEATKSYPQTETVEAKPDWIETNARTIGYVKHPLEFILECLDRAILWLERILVNIFLFFKGLLRGK